jgi:hypothetical protein
MSDFLANYIAAAGSGKLSSMNLASPEGCNEYDLRCKVARRYICEAKSVVNQSYLRWCTIRAQIESTSYFDASLRAPQTGAAYVPL